jgi:hypothetical protein
VSPAAEGGNGAGQIVIDVDGSFHQADATGTVIPPMARSAHPPPAHPNPPITDADRFLAAVLFTDQVVDHLDALARQHTASRTFLDLAIDPGGVAWYRPSLRGGAGRSGRERAELANAYDRFQSERGDPRRAFREG